MNNATHSDMHASNTKNEYEYQHEYQQHAYYTSALFHN